MRKEDKPDIYIVGFNRGPEVTGSYGIMDPRAFESFEDIQKWLENGWCTASAGWQIETVKHADWHGAGLISLIRQRDGRTERLTARVFVSKVYSYDS